MILGMRFPVASLVPIVLAAVASLGAAAAQQAGSGPGGSDAGGVEPVDFTRQIAPILVARCIECHGPKEEEGDLRLDRREFVFPEGDEDWWTVQPKKPDDSELLIRIGLPLEDEDIMPAKGDPLTKEQQALIERWIAEGASWPEAGDAWIAAELEAQKLPMITFELPQRSVEQQQEIDRAITGLRELGAVVQRVAADTDAVDANLSLLRDKVTDETVALLEPLAPVLVWLNLSRTAIGDDACDSLAKLTELRRLNVSGTDIADAGAARLSSLQKLEHLNAYGTGLGDAGLAELAKLPKLTHVYAWQSKVTKAGAAAANSASAALEVDLGDYVAERLQTAEAEIEAREQRNRPANEVCPVSGEKVDPVHASEHDGKRIAFCCPKCKAKFDADPAQFAAKVREVVGGGEGDDKQPINETCPVSGEAVDPAQTVEHDGRVVAFCCGNCKAKFEADPSAFVAKLPESGGKKGK